MQLKPLSIDPDDGPDRDTLIQTVNDYRKFVGTKAAFQVEYLWWEGTFDTKEEEMDFFMSDQRLDDYETIDKWHDEAIADFAACDIDLMDTKRSRNWWRAIAAILFIPYAIIIYLWDK